MSDQGSIVFLGVEVDLFKSCFFPREEEPRSDQESTVLLGVESLLKSCFFPQEEPDRDKQWTSHELVVLDVTSASVSGDLSDALRKPDVRSVIFQNTELDASLLVALKEFYDSGGLVVFFGIYGVASEVSRLSKRFRLPEAWSSMGSAAHGFEITSTAMDSIGYGMKEQPYTKSNLVRVPVQDRWMVAKPQPLHEYVEEHAGCLDGEAPDYEWKYAAEKAKAGYVDYCENCYEQCPLAVHKNGNGGRLAYLGFVSGEDNIPKIVRALVTQKEISHG